MEPFIISFWHDPPATLERYQELAECDFTLAASEAQTATEGMAVLDLCAQTGLKAMLIDPRITGAVDAHDGWQDEVKAAVADYRGHPALWGYYITDEPGYPLFEQPGKRPYIALEYFSGGKSLH